MVAARTPRMLAPFHFDRIIDTIDWNRVLIQAEGLHLTAHPLSKKELCGECVKTILHRREDDS